MICRMKKISTICEWAESSCLLNIYFNKAVQIKLCVDEFQIKYKQQEQYCRKEQEQEQYCGKDVETWETLDL